MSRALLVSAKPSPAMKELLAGFFGEIDETYSGYGAEQMLKDGTYDLCVINAPLPDEYGGKLAEYAAGSGGTQCVLLADADLSRLEQKGVCVLKKPPSRREIEHTLRAAAAAARKFGGVIRENAGLKELIEEIKLLERAKFALMSGLGLSEPEAHRHIEKRAMDMRRAKRQIAEDILRTYENII